MTKPKPRLWWALARSFGGPFVAAGFLKLLHDSLQFVRVHLSRQMKKRSAMEIGSLVAGHEWREAHATL